MMLAIVRLTTVCGLLGLLILSIPGIAPAGLAGTVNSLSETVRRSVEDYVRCRVTQPGDSVAVSVDVPVFGVEPHEVADFALDLLSSKPVVGTVPVKVTFTLSGGGELTYAATARVRVFADVLVVDERLSRHEIVTGDALRTELREVTNLTDAYFTDAAEAEGKRARRVISPGRILKASDVERVPLVDRGAGVTVAVVLGSVTVTSKARALEDGEMGEIIKVQDLTTGKRLVGTVAARGLVVLDESML
jgi:flagella basal body P-ring formation protein FlgA